MTEETEEKEDEITIYRLTKSTTLARFAPRIHELRSIVNKPEIIYEGLYTYLMATVQQSEYLLPKGIKPLREFTIVAVNQIPVGFAHWVVKPPPLYMATAYTDFFYLWEDESGAALEALMARFIAFGRRNKCEFFEIDHYDDHKNMKLVRKIFEEKKLFIGQREAYPFFALEKKFTENS